MLKKIGKNFLCSLLESQVKQLRAKNDLTIVAVVGSVGKTSGKLAIAKTLASRSNVIYQDGNYNDRLTVPLVLFGHTEPGIFNIFAWIRILIANQRQLAKKYLYDIAVLELGTDGPGQLAQFAYLKPEIVVVTAIAVEHIEYFGTIDAIAAEELEPLAYSKLAILNIDDIDPIYLPSTNYLSVSIHQKADYTITARDQQQLLGQSLELKTPHDRVKAIVALQGKPGAKSALVATAVADQLGWTADQISTGLAKITPVAGRMRILNGAKQSTLIDDTYNASPIAVTAALDTLYHVDAPQKIAILGSMNELGNNSAAEHTAIGNYCDPSKIDLVITIGEPAETNLAPTAIAKNCSVKSFVSPYDAGRFALEQLHPGGVVLAKGSQNGVFAEEALKQLLANPADTKKLVRQSNYWMAVKAKQFPQQ
jgi:UDP-N-acetylmuramoyl-tripeptide--D-alanyl-D-alanine ligase